MQLVSNARALSISFVVPRSGCSARFAGPEKVRGDEAVEGSFKLNNRSVCTALKMLKSEITQGSPEGSWADSDPEVGFLPRRGGCTQEGRRTVDKRARGERKRGAPVSRHRAEDTVSKRDKMGRELI